MVEEQVVITAIEKEGAWVEGIQQSACGSCSAKAGCGQHAMSQLGKKVSLWLPFHNVEGNESALNEADSLNETFCVGQQIVVGLPEGAILRSTLVLYGVPLIALVFGAIIGHGLWGEGGSILVSILSMLLGFQLARRWSLDNKQHWQPHFIRNCFPVANIHNGENIIQSLK